jgi:hypothetical protein
MSANECWENEVGLVDRINQRNEDGNMANKPSIRVQVSLRRVVDFTEERSGYQDKPQENRKSEMPQGKSASGRRVR